MNSLSKLLQNWMAGKVEVRWHLSYLLCSCRSQHAIRFIVWCFSQRRINILFVLLTFGIQTSNAEQFFKCVAPDGSVLYQSQQCADNHETHIVKTYKNPQERREPYPEPDDDGQYWEENAENDRTDDERQKAERESKAEQRRKEVEHRRDMCADATRSYGVYANGLDWTHLTRGQREDPNILYFRDEMSRYCE